jgi:hypothetical protein
MSFETSFPDEIILEICRYLHPLDILLSLSELNSRLNRTISAFIRHVCLSSVISYKNYVYLLQMILPPIWPLIQSLTISNCQVPCLTTLFLDNTKPILPPNLKRLRLIHLNINEIYHFVNRLINQCVIEELIIECTDIDTTNQQELYGYKLAQILFFHHPTLKSIELRGEIIFDLCHLSFLSLSNHDKPDVRDIFLLIDYRYRPGLEIGPFLAVGPGPKRPKKYCGPPGPAFANHGPGPTINQERICLYKQIHGKSTYTSSQ